MDERYAMRSGGTDGSSAPHVDPDGHVSDIAGLTVIAIPPGRVDLHVANIPCTLNVMPSGHLPVEEFRLNGGRSGTLSRANASAVLGIYAAGQELYLRGDNASWELLIELDDRRLGDIAIERFDGRAVALSEYVLETDLTSGTLGQLLIEHLRFADRDPLYVESLAVAIVSRRLAALDGARDDVSTAGTDRRIRRVIDYIDSFLDRPLALEELARVAGMSPSWLTRGFRRATGLPVHAFVRERRLERARTMIGGEESLSTVALACGFWDQAHLTRAFRKRYGMTPGALRRERGRVGTSRR